MSYESFDNAAINFDQVNANAQEFIEKYGYDSEDYDSDWVEDMTEDNFPGDNITETYFDFNDYEYQQQIYL